jgi:hypothetical protein
MKIGACLPENLQVNFGQAQLRLQERAWAFPPSLAGLIEVQEADLMPQCDLLLIDCELGILG